MGTVLKLQRDLIKGSEYADLQLGSDPHFNVDSVLSGQVDVFHKGRSLGGLVGLPARKGASRFLSRLKERLCGVGARETEASRQSRSFSFDRQTVPYQGEGPANLSPTFGCVAR